MSGFESASQAAGGGFPPIFSGWRSLAGGAGHLFNLTDEVFLMAVSLVKGANVSLDKAVPGLKSIMIGLGWDARATDGAGFDLDASAFLLSENDKIKQPKDFIFYNNLASGDGSVEHTGDNRTGEGEGDDESIKVNLAAVPEYVRKIAVVVTIHEADVRRQNFGMVSNAFMRIINTENNQEIARFDLTEDMSTETAMIFGEVYRHNGEWKFKAVGQGYSGGLGAMATNYGVSVKSS
jgi:tellurium resistance protein TerD